MSTIIRVLLISLVLTGVLQAQKVTAVYKTGDLLKRINHKDTLYIVNFWATWCKPCVEEIASFDSLQTSYSSSPVKILLVCLDFAEDLDKKVNPFLKKKRISSECILLDEVNGNDYIDKIDPQWSGAIPATFFVINDKKRLAEQKMNLKTLHQIVTGMLQ